MREGGISGISEEGLFSSPRIQYTTIRRVGRINGGAHEHNLRPVARCSLPFRPQFSSSQRGRPCSAQICTHSIAQHGQPDKPQQLCVQLHTALSTINIDTQTEGLVHNQYNKLIIIIITEV